MTATLHASCVAIGGRGVLLSGRSGSGKSDLALRLIDRGARLISDDYVLLTAAGGRLIAEPPAAIAGRIEIRGIGIVGVAHETGVPICLLADLDLAPERMPGPRAVEIEGIAIPAFGLSALEASAPIKVETALNHFGLQST